MFGLLNSANVRAWTNLFQCSRQSLSNTSLILVELEGDSDR